MKTNLYFIGLIALLIITIMLGAAQYQELVTVRRELAEARKLINHQDWLLDWARYQLSQDGDKPEITIEGRQIPTPSY